MGIASRKQRSSTEEPGRVPPMPWALTGIVFVGLVGLSGFWVAVIVWNFALLEIVSFSDLCSGVAGIVLALTHVGLHAIAVLFRRQWAASTVVVFLALEGWLLSVACFAVEPAMILIGLAALTFALCFATCYWRYKAFNYPSFFSLLSLFKGR